MTEAEWLACPEPTRMLDFLRTAGLATDRKGRLFTAACCRRAWHLLDPAGRAVVEMSERFADGTADEAELMAAVWASRGGLDVDVRAAADHSAVGAWPSAVALLAGTDARQAAEEPLQAGLLRDVLGPLPCRTLRLDLGGGTSLVGSLAQTAYETRFAPAPSRPGWLILDPARLAVLADAVEDAGGYDTEQAEHLRTPGPHLRGCWVIDILLGKG